MIDLEHKAAMDRYLFAPKGMKRQRYVKMTVEQRDNNNAACARATAKERTDG